MLKTISWLDWENKSKLRQINNNKKLAVAGGERDQSGVAEKGCSNVKYPINVYVGLGPAAAQKRAEPMKKMKVSEAHANSDVFEYVGSVLSCAPKLLISPLNLCMCMKRHFESPSLPCTCALFVTFTSRSRSLSTKLERRQTSKHQQYVLLSANSAGNLVSLTGCIFSILFG